MAWKQRGEFFLEREPCVTFRRPHLWVVMSVLPLQDGSFVLSLSSNIIERWKYTTTTISTSADYGNDNDNDNSKRTLECVG